MSAGGYQTDERGNSNLFPTRIVNVAGQAITATSPFDIATPLAGLSLRIVGYDLSTSVTNAAVIFKSGATSATNEILRTSRMPASTGHASPPMGRGVATNAPGDKVALDVTATATVDGFVMFAEVPESVS